MRWWSLPTKCWELSALTAFRVGTWGRLVLHSNCSIILPLQTHAVFWSCDWEQLLFLNKQQQLSWSPSCTQANSLKSLVSLWSNLFLALVKKKYIWSVAGRRPLLPLSSCAFHISLNCISYHLSAREANPGDVNRTPPSRLCVVKELLLLGDLEQRLEWARAASLGETFLFLSRVKGQCRPSDSSNKSGTKEQFQKKSPK